MSLFLLTFWAFKRAIRYISDEKSEDAAPIPNAIVSIVNHSMHHSLFLITFTL